MVSKTRENMPVPSQTSRSYDDQYLRICRSNDLLFVSENARTVVVGGLHTSSGRLAGVDVADDDHVDVQLLFAMGERIC